MCFITNNLLHALNYISAYYMGLVQHRSFWRIKEIICTSHQTFLLDWISTPNSGNLRHACLLFLTIFNMQLRTKTLPILLILISMVNLAVPSKYTKLLNRIHPQFHEEFWRNLTLLLLVCNHIIVITWYRHLTYCKLASKPALREVSWSKFHVRKFCYELTWGRHV
jgi:hypothetical protein